MLKKNIRERKEYLFKRQEEIKNKLIHQKKQQLKSKISKVSNDEEENKLYSKNKELFKNVEADDIDTELPYTAADDEYNTNKNIEPKILLTTSRDCSNRLHQFLQEFRLLIPNSYKCNRGNLVIKELVQIAKEKEFTDIILLHENRGQPDGLILCHLPYGPTTYFGLFNVILRHDIKEEVGTVSEAFPHLIFENFHSRLGERLVEILRALYPVPKMDSTRVLSFVNNDDVISFRHHTYVKKGKEVELKEHGPRFDMRPYQIMLGTLDMPESQKEWVLRPYMNTARKNNMI